MPRAPVAGKEIRRRSRNGCWNCKARKVKCGEEKPRCSNCTRLGEECDYKIRLSWGGRPLKKKLLEQGAQLDDASQNIPGAGQFSLNTTYPQQPQFPTPAQFEQARHSTRTSPTLSACTTKSSSSRKSTSSQAGLATYQNVFSVCEASPPTSLVTSSVSTPLHFASTSFPPQSSHHLHPYGLWTLDSESGPLTPSTASTADSDLSYMSEESVFVPSTMDFYQMSSPTPSLTHLTIGSPGGTSSSSIPPSPHSSFTDLGIFHQRSSVTSSPPPGLTNDIAYNQAMVGTVPNLSVPVPATAGMSRGVGYYAGPVTPPNLSNQETIRGNPYVAGVDKSNRRSVDGFAAPQDYLSFADRYVPSGGGFNNQQMVGAQSTAVPFGIGIVDADGDAVEELHRQTSALDSKGSFISDGYGTIKAHSSVLQLPKELHSVPSTLAESQQNAMYFQHFVGQTSQLLVPHDCAGNPFKTLLPQMAMQNDGLLNLLLAYSASHQARQTNQQEPTELVSGFLGRAYRHLHESLNDVNEQKSNSTLATAIMLCSYEIISPNSVAGVTWQLHLNAARRIILARGGATAMHSHEPVSFFLSRWFAYLDVLGSFSRKNTEKPLFPGKYWTEEGDDLNGMADFSVDCFFGFTNRFIGLLTRIDELIRQTTNVDWADRAQLYTDALRLREQLEESRRHAVGFCRHEQAPVNDTAVGLKYKEILASNDAFHWAAQIHISRRVLKQDKGNQDVQDAIRHIIEAMHHIPEQSNVANAVLFPLFTAGCDSIDEEDRSYILRRLTEIEKSGLTQFYLARNLMQRVWETGSSWEALINGEFIG